MLWSHVLRGLLVLCLAALSVGCGSNGGCEDLEGFDVCAQQVHLYANQICDGVQYGIHTETECNSERYYADNAVENVCFPKFCEAE